MGDEGVGVHVVRALEKHTLPAGVECLDGGTGGFILLEPLQQADRIILIDAAADGNPLGTVTRTTPQFVKDYPPTLTAHDIGVKDLLDAFYMQGGNARLSSMPSPSIRISRSRWNFQRSARGCAGCRRGNPDRVDGKRLHPPDSRNACDRACGRRGCKSDHFSLIFFVWK